MALAWWLFAKAKATEQSFGSVTIASDQRDKWLAAAYKAAAPQAVAERVLLTASKVGADKLPDDKGPTTRVQFALK